MMIIILLSIIPTYLGTQKPYVILKDFLCETQGAGLHISKWKTLIRNKRIC